MTDPAAEKIPAKEQQHLIAERASEAQRAIDDVVRSWRESELAKFNEADVKNLGKHAR